MRQLKISKQLTDRSDISFNKYLTEVSGMETITPEEEIRLTRLIKQGDLRARDKLVTANLRFVISVAKQYNGQAPLPDLVNEGNLGIIKAAEKFDETKGFKFISYAVWWIRQSILQYIAEYGRPIRLPLNKIGVVNKIKSAMSHLEQELQRVPSNEEISEYLMEIEMNKSNESGKFVGEPSRYTVDKIQESLSTSQSMSSLDAPLTSDSESGSLIDFVQDGSENNIDDTIRVSDLQKDIERIIKNLKPREREVLIMCFGLFGTPVYSLENIGEKLDLTRERVRQIREKGIRRMKTYSSKKILVEYR